MSEYIPFSERKRQADAADEKKRIADATRWATLLEHVCVTIRQFASEVPTEGFIEVLKPATWFNEYFQPRRLISLMGPPLGQRYCIAEVLPAWRFQKAFVTPPSDDYEASSADLFLVPDGRSWVYDWRERPPDNHTYQFHYGNCKRLTERPPDWLKAVDKLLHARMDYRNQHGGR